MFPFSGRKITKTLRKTDRLANVFASFLKKLTARLAFFAENA
jgi:hypothetical protein